VTPAAAPARKHRRVTVALASVKVTLAAGETKVVRPTLSRADARRLVIAAKGTTGEPAAVTKRVRATR
jgi:hypothetical protein